MNKCIGMLMLSCAVFTSAQAPKPKTPPTISVEVREKFFKAQSEYQNAAETLREATTLAQTKNTTLQEQVKNIQVVCGTEFQPNIDKDGELVCVDKPKTPEPAKK